MLDAFADLELHDAIKQVNAKVRAKVNSALIEKLAAALPPKLQEQGIITTVVAKSSEDQSEFFFDFVSRIQSNDPPS